jgi:hypothetical protein
VPVLGRPANAETVTASLRETSVARLLFLATRGDREQVRACDQAARRWEHVEVHTFPPAARGDYARKINAGVRLTGEPWLLMAADDLRFRAGWQEAALDAAERTGCRVIGTDDRCNPRVMRGRHSTHSLVARSYIEEHGTADEPGKMLHEGYEHNFVDDELVQTAVIRREFVRSGAVIEHLHPNCGGADDDDTYRLGLSGFHRDRQMFRQRLNSFRRDRRRTRIR